MSTFRRIWSSAILAGQQMALDPQVGDRPFEILLQKHPSDGMVLYERGEAFEYLGAWDRAEHDYEEAEQLLILPQWKAVARRAQARVCSRRHSPAASTRDESLQWSAFHLVHAAPRAPHKLRVRAISALARIDSEPESGVADLRSCLEELVVATYRRSAPAVPPPRDLEEKIRMLGLLRIAGTEIIGDMHLLRRIGNKGAHADAVLDPGEIESAVRAFISLLKWSVQNVWLPVAR